MKNVAILISIFAILLFTSCSGGGATSNGWLGGGLTLGGLLAVLASWDRNKSVLWAILHFLLGWIYVVYWVLTRK